MASLQGTLEYQGNLDQVFISNFDVAIYTPKFLYTTTANTEYEYFGRQLDGYAISTKTLGLRERTYHFDLPVESIIGEQTSSQYGFFRYYRIEPLVSSNIDDFVFDIKYVVSDEYGNEIGEQEFKAIYGFQSSLSEIDRRHKDELHAYIQKLGSFGNINLPSLQSFIQNEKNKNFIINKEAYDDLREQLQQHVGNDNDFYLLHLIEGLVDLSSRQPKAVRNITSSRQDGLFRILRDAEVDESQHGYILELIIQFFNRLFNFPIVLPEVEVINIGGTFSILSDEALTRNNLEFYSLSVEYPQKGSALKIIRYNWHQNSAELINNRIIFSFTNDQPIILGSIDNVLSIKVKGFDGSLLWNKEFYPPDAQLERLEIEVPTYRPNAINVSSSSGRPASIKRLRGKVVQFGNKYSLNELTIVIQAKRDGDEIWRIVGATTTDNSGNFSLEYPYGRYVEAQALVSLMPNSPANIETNPENSTNETISDNFIYLLLQDSEVVPPEEPKKVKDCDCGTPNITKRLPDQTDLIESGEYTQDIGGTCLNLSTPNRTLREYSYNAIVRTSDPDVANYILQKSEEGNTVKYALVGRNQKIQRGIVDLDNPIRWEDAPDAKSNLSLYQAVTVATGHILYFKSVFKADGYSLGDLVYSLPLAPGQKKQIVVFESSHALTGAESQTLSQGERLSAELINDRFITDQLSGAIGEDLSGRSSASTAGVSAGLGVGGSLGGIGGSLGVAGGYANSRSDASQNSSRNISQFFGEKLRQSIMQNAESYRQLNASVVTTVTQGQNYGVTSEVVANHNHCHSMTLMYFDVLRHYAIFQEVSHVEECVFVPLLMTHFTSENIHKWKDILARYLLPMPSSTYLQPSSFLLKGRQHPLLKAFDANERIKTRYARVDFPPEGETYADGVITQIMGQFSMNVNIPRPKTRYDRIKSLPVITKAVSRQEIDVEGTIKRNALAAAGGPLGFF
ncbi:MAG: hypothetical protein HC836_50445, partial [Richelia sp. RM2_1_2]|nr:hypothetical protein [Richelia sp. RM2_1_2]